MKAHFDKEPYFENERKKYKESSSSRNKKYSWTFRPPWCEVEKRKSVPFF